MLNASAVEMKGCPAEPVYMSRRQILAPVEEKGSFRGVQYEHEKEGSQAPWFFQWKYANRQTLYIRAEGPLEQIMLITFDFTVFLYYSMIASTLHSLRPIP
jgi:hypothetical protein